MDEESAHGAVDVESVQGAVNVESARGQWMGKCHGAADEESASRAMDEESAEGQWMKKVLIEGNGWREGSKGNDWSMLLERAGRILAVGV